MKLLLESEKVKDVRTARSRDAKPSDARTASCLGQGQGRVCPDGAVASGSAGARDGGEAAPIGCLAFRFEIHSYTFLLTS